MAISNSKALRNEVNLDAIISQLMDGLSVAADSSFKEHEQAVINSARGYTKTIMQQADNKALSDEKVTTIVEENIGELLDSICEQNHIFLEAGIRIGASLLLELLGYTQTEYLQNKTVK